MINNWLTDQKETPSDQVSSSGPSGVSPHGQSLMLHSENPFSDPLGETGALSTIPEVLPTNESVLLPPQPNGKYSKAEYAQAQSQLKLLKQKLSFSKSWAKPRPIRMHSDGTPSLSHLKIRKP